MGTTGKNFHREQANFEVPLVSHPSATATLQKKHTEFSQGICPQELSAQELCVHQLFEAQVERTPDAVAVVFADQQLTYRQLNQRANQLAHTLREFGVCPDQLVGIYVERSLEMVIGLLSVLKAGGAYVPLDPALPSERLAFILEDTKVSVILTHSQFADGLSTHAAKVFCLDRDGDACAQNSSENPVNLTTPNHLIYTIYTSGSTGRPKGVMIPHAGICNQLSWRQATFPLTPADRVLQNIPFSFDPSVWQILWPLSVGAQLILPSPGGHRDSRYLVNFMAAQQITVIALVPSMLRVLLEEPTLECCTSLRHIFCGGEALPFDLQERFFTRFPVKQDSPAGALQNVFPHSVFLHNVYGPTEASIDATFWTCEPGQSYRVAPIGRPITNMQVRILDADLQPVPCGQPGELHIGGAGLARGYLNRPELTAEKFITDPHRSDSHCPDSHRPDSHCSDPAARLYKTGDLARYLPDGKLEFLGRIDHQVKVRGFRIELGEIETVLNQHPAINDSLVITHEVVPGDQRLVAYLVASQAAQPSAPSPKELRAFLKAKLPEYMIPTAFVFLKAFPLNPNGKIDRHALPDPALERPDLEETLVAARDSVEMELINLWQQALNIQPIGIEDNFFELGGTSLLAAKLFVQIEEKFGKKLLLSQLSQAPTIQQLAAFLREDRQDNSFNALVALQPQGSKPPLFCLHSRSGHLLNYYPLIPHLSPDQPLYGLQTPVVNGEYMPYQRVEEMATNYIREIRTLQPKGPYFLAGYSLGGLIAYEIARQLENQGESVGLLALIDTYNSPTGWFKSIPARARYAKHLRNLFQCPSWEAKRAYLKEKFFEKFTPDPLDAHYSQLLPHYQPRSYSGRAVLFRADPNQLEAAWLQSLLFDPALGWQPLITGGIEIEDIDCHHFNIMLEPAVGLVGRKLQACIDAAIQQSQS